jgi:hypothetical protein
MEGITAALIGREIDSDLQKHSYSLLVKLKNGKAY